MRNLYKILILTCTLSFIQSSVFAQVPGYKGKRFILKTDLTSPILERGYNLELETFVLRDLSISLDYSQRSKLDYVHKYEVGDTASYRGNTIGLKIRSYLNKAIPGPIGVYSFLLGRYGSVDVDRRYLETNPTIFKTISYENLEYFQIGIGWGYQTLFKERLSLDAGWTFLYSHFDYFSPLSYHYSTAYGHNLILLSDAFDTAADHWGISIQVSVGILLF